MTVLSSVIIIKLKLVHSILVIMPKSGLQGLKKSDADIIQII